MNLVLLQPGDPGVVGLGGVEGASDSSWNKLSDEDSGEPLPFDGKHCIELVSIGYGMKRQVTTDVSNSARTSGRPVITVTCVKYLDKSSVRLNELCLRAKPLGVGAEQPTRIFILSQSGDRLARIMTLSLRDALLSEIQFQSHPDGRPTEQFKLSFSEILWTYNARKTDTTNGAEIQVGWSVARNRPVSEFRP